MGVSVTTARNAWHYLYEHGAPKRVEFMEGENGIAYDFVVHYIRTQRRRKHGLKRGWTIALAERLGITRGRVSQLHKQALAKGDI